MKKLFNSCWFYIITGICLGFLIKFFLLDFMQVTGNSMKPTLNNGDWIIVVKAFHKKRVPEKGDLITFKKDGKTVVKRCSLVPGDSMEFLQNSDYNLISGGNKIALTEQQFNLLKDCSVVPDSCIFVLGDNPSESFDSRAYGFISTTAITGKVLFKQ